LINAITKDMIDNYPQQIINMTPDPVFVLAAPGGYPDANRYKQWLQDLKNQTKFYALKQVLRKNYIGKAFSTETLANRFYNTKQYYYDKVARKTVVHSVQEFHAKLLALVEEVKGMDANQANSSVPELDVIFYNNLVAELHGKETLAQLTNHPPSTNLPEKVTRLLNIVNQAVIEEEAVKQVKMIVDRVSPQRRMGFNNNAGNLSANPSSFTTSQVHYDPPEERRTNPWNDDASIGIRHSRSSFSTVWTG
jgi:predicted S18 family serine protease